MCVFVSATGKCLVSFFFAGSRWTSIEEDNRKRKKLDDLPCRLQHLQVQQPKSIQKKRRRGQQENVSSVLYVSFVCQVCKTKQVVEEHGWWTRSEKFTLKPK